jgi:hypothetical protein
MREFVYALCDVVLVCSVAGKSVAVRLFCAGRGVWPLDPEAADTSASPLMVNHVMHAFTTSPFTPLLYSLHLLLDICKVIRALRD